MTVYPSVYEAKEQIVEIGKRMYAKGLVVSNDGNISCKISPTEILATPTGVSKGFMDREMIVKMSMDGNVIGYSDYKPSSEVKMHLRVYKENPDVVAVVHAHPLYATSFAIAGIGLDQPILTETIMALGSVPVAKYATPGTQEVPDSIAPFCTQYNAVLMANHGALTWGDSLMQAYHRMESLEYYANIIFNTGYIIGQSRKLSCEQVGPLMDIRAKLGVNAGGDPACSLRTMNNRDVMPASGPLEECSCCGRKDTCETAKQQVAEPKDEPQDTKKLIEQITLEVIEKLKKAGLR
jgi:L-fuculose-phosphate aldolase